jgi:hypothetical protein
LLVAFATAVAIASADEHQGAQQVLVDDLARLLKGGVESMVEADLGYHLALGGGTRSGTHLVNMTAGRLFYQDVAASPNGAQRDRGQLVVASGDDDGIDVGVDRLAPIVDRAGASLLCQGFGFRPIVIADNDDIVPARGRRALAPDKAASNDRQTH